MVFVEITGKRNDYEEENINQRDLASRSPNNDDDGDGDGDDKDLKVQCRTLLGIDSNVGFV